jgi:KUP system potassium uptake protein
MDRGRTWLNSERLATNNDWDEVSSMSVNVTEELQDAKLAAAPAHEAQAHHHGGHGARTSLAALALCALGVVFGDIGTSPLYTLKECLHAAGGDKASVADLYGILSLMFWALVMVVTVKYLIFIMRADHNGEGGIFALLAIVPERFRACAPHSGKVTAMALLAVIGASLLYGDGVITPAISVLSAVEGLAVASRRLEPLVVPLTCIILIALFAIQRRGTGDVGKLFGPIMLVWFLTMAALGIYEIAHRPEILGALSPHHGALFFYHRGIYSLLILGSVVLAVTGGEALYADMGHFGIKPIRLAWSFFVLPSLVLGYLGQGALLLGDGTGTAIDARYIENPFFAQVPNGIATYLLVALSSAATVIASQALISGAFSLTRQAMLLGYLPRVTIKHTAYHTEGQIYIPEVNNMLAVGCIMLVLTFRESVKLAAAYGIAVTGTMAITSILYYIVVRHTWGWSRLKAGSILCLFLAFDIPFLIANMFKFFDGGYVPMLIGASLIAGMLIWSRGRTALMERYFTKFPTMDAARPLLDRWLCSRVPGSAVFLAPTAEHVPPVLMHLVERGRSLHQTVVLLTVLERPVPEVAPESRYELTDLGQGFYKLIVWFGYMEEPLLLPVLREIARIEGIPLDVDAATYFVGHETIVASEAGSISRIPEAVFSYLNRNAVHEERRYGMPLEQVVEIGTQIDL